MAMAEKQFVTVKYNRLNTNKTKRIKQNTNHSILNAWNIISITVYGS